MLTHGREALRTSTLARDPRTEGRTRTSSGMAGRHVQMSDSDLVSESGTKWAK